MNFITISNNLILRLFEQKDAEEFFKLIKKNKTYLTEFMPRILETKSLYKAKKVIEIFESEYVNQKGFRTAIFWGKDMIGVAGLKNIDTINNKSEIMYWIDRDYAQKGIASACVTKLIEIAFEKYNNNKIIIKTSVNNIASIRVAEKCGFILEATLKDDELLLNGYTNVNIYSLLKKDYIKKT
ncbi:MAG: GNAT family protein [Candidatus Cloacimonadales bacterium]|jgi:ribosomal-protein-serine acetyltransferase|nr:GNAT family protein [Candidatus Cloacimonadota bacterium]MDD3500814.1 GNAT family protein [Candidatus Cloacimonadota bacterium]MDX9978069.1 GNAT family protein [Candidatus Cloacimonadales bacterium]